MLQNKYNFKFKYEWKNYIDNENHKNYRNTSWDFDNIIKSYKKDLAQLFLIHLEISTNKKTFKPKKRSKSFNRLFYNKFKKMIRILMKKVKDY